MKSDQTSRLVSTHPIERRRRWWSMPAAFLATLLALPASAGIVIPDQPLTIGARIPPNILFILDNSGSMRDDYLPDGAPSGWRRSTYFHNKIYYNPATSYLPWVDSTGATMTGGQDYREVYAGTERIPPFDYSTLDLRLGVRTFYVPKSLAGDMNNQTNYWRYQIWPDEVIVRSEYIARAGSAPNYNRGLDLRDCSVATGTQWRNCTRAVPGSRTEAEELANFATWYSYHRTRYKIAKAASGRAFAEIGSEYRVGYRNIWNDMPVSGTTGGINWLTHPLTRAKPIPVTRNKGLFDDPSGPAGADNNKTAWYERLYAETGGGSTPLREALYQAGQYFSTDTTNTGPWGPDQYACRQNFALLTTDGYRNDGNWSRVGEEDNSSGPEIENPSGAPYTYTPTSPYSSGYSSTLADIAMRYWKNDLRTDLDNVVPTSTANPAFWQHMVTFSISLGAAGTLNPDTDLPDLTNGTREWPNPGNLTPESIDDLWHAAVNGRGTFVMASDADEFARALKGALSEISGRASSYSNVASNSVSLDTDAQVFNASYIPGSWTGALTARAVSSAGVSSTISWNASLPTWSDRKIFTSNGTSGEAFPTTGQLALLARTGSALNYPVTAVNNANYIKGDASQEEDQGVGVLRDRTIRLGDIVGSSPAYVKETNTIYVGANDGMLHAFDARNGRELFAYVPSIINFNHLSTLSRGDYAHKFFVDGPIAVSSRTLTPGRSLLVGTLGKGGKGLYSLDVTNPAAATATSVHKWARAETPGNNMGLVLGRPFMARASTGVTAVVTGNGINSTSERAVLLVLNAETGAVIREIDTGVGSAAAPNGLSAPTGIYGADGKTLAYVYAGDMLGNVWKFNLTDASPASWTATRLFTAVGPASRPQPITAAVTLGTHPVTKKRWVFFGTGRYLTADDAQSTSVDVQSMYGFMDDSAAYSRTNLTQRTITVTTATVGGYPVRGFQANAPLSATSKGWYIDLPSSGERIVQDAQMASTFLITASMIPTGNACNADGSGFINALDAFTGTSALGSYFDLDGDGRTDDASLTGGLPVGSVNVQNGMPTLPNLLRGLIVVGGTGSDGLRSPRTSQPRWDRASWREIRRD